MVAQWLRARLLFCSPRFESGVSPSTADCQSPSGLPPGMALGCGVTSVRGNRGENYKNELLVRQKHIKKKIIHTISHPTILNTSTLLLRCQYLSSRSFLTILFYSLFYIKAAPSIPLPPPPIPPLLY
jgi:hypothetical protein